MQKTPHRSIATIAGYSKLTGPIGKVCENGVPIQNLWIAEGLYYAQLNVPGNGSRRYTLRNPDGSYPRTLQEAKDALSRLKQGLSEAERPDGQPEGCPTLAELVPLYLNGAKSIGGKSEKTLVEERYRLQHWVNFCGDLRISQLMPSHVKRFIEKRRLAGVKASTINLDLQSLNVALRFAQDNHMLTTIYRLPTKGLYLPDKSTVRPLLATEDLARLVERLRMKKEDGTTPRFKYGETAARFILFAAYSGARRNAALRVRWTDIRFDLQQVHLRDNNKGGTPLIVVNFNSKLKQLLEEMRDDLNGRNPRYLFSRGGESAPKEFSILQLIDFCVDELKLDFHIHDLRHYFASHCVASGVDYLTVANWLGHKDGGQLVATRYGHLCPEKARIAAEKVNF